MLRDGVAWCQARSRHSTDRPLDDQDRATEKTAADVKDSRRDRLKLALRENLKRRKSQARGRSDAGASSESADTSLDTADEETR